MSLGRLLNRISDMDSASVEALEADIEWEDTVARVRREIDEWQVPEQRACFNDPSRYVAVCCARQSGKTTTAARLLIDTALAIPESIGVYVSDTWDNAVKAMWIDQADGLPAVLSQLGLIDRDTRSSDGTKERDWHFHINLSTRTITFRNRSIVELAGADRGAWAKFRGRRLNLIVADEMQRQDNEGLVAALKRDIPDCLMVRRGRFVGMGTVGRALTGLWFEINAGVHGLCEVPRGWSAHHWTAQELSSKTNVWFEQLEWARAMGIDTATDSEWLREKRGIWVRDAQGLLHTLTSRSLWRGLTGPLHSLDGGLPPLIRSRCPEHGKMRGRCVCEVPMVPRSMGTPHGETQVYAGLDLGFNDPNAVVIGGISREEGVLRELHSEQAGGLDTAQLASWLRGLMERFGIRRFYSDPAWRITLEDLRTLYGLPVEPAVKGDAEGTTEDLWHSERQAALRDGSAQVIEGGLLHRQLETVLRDPTLLAQGRLRAMDGQDDHALDAWRYLFRMVRTRHVQVPEPPESIDGRMTREAAEAKAKALSPRDRERQSNAQRLSGITRGRRP